GVVAAALASGSWVLMFHGIYGRMYSLFLFTSLLSFLALLSALDHGGRRRFVLWGVALFLMLASHPYAVLVVAAQGLFVVVRRRRESIVLFACVVAVPGVAFMLATLNSTASPEARHLIFALPFFSVLLAAPIVELGRRGGPLGPALAAIAVAMLLFGEVRWTH